MTEVLIFAAQALIVFVVIAALIVLIAVLIARGKDSSDVEVTALHDKWKDLGFFLKSYTGTKEEAKAERKRLKKERKAEAKKSEPDDLGHVYVLEFEGDIQANQVDNLREEVTALLQVTTPKDEVVVVLESPGGMVSGYGLAAAQLLRFKNRGIKVTVCVDQVAASGGYMMACTADKIVAAPFAVLGSIGVVAQFPNFAKLLKKHDVDYRQYTAGEYKRTVGIMTEITPDAEAKFKEQLEETHVLFKDFVQTYRPKIDISKLGTGEHWYGKRALELGLVDEIKTSDDYLLEKFHAKSKVFKVEYDIKKPFTEKLAGFMGSATGSVLKAFQRAASQETERMAQPPRF